MNQQRIQELYKMAMVTVPETPGNAEFTWFDPERFAELIVRECAELNFRELGLSGSDSFDVSRMIKQHFGVEE